MASKDTAKTGTERIPLKDGKRTLPEPVVEVAAPVASKAPTKKPDPNKPKDVNVTSRHIIQAFSSNMANNRMTRLIELGRRNNDVKWLLAEHADLSAKKK